MLFAPCTVRKASLSPYDSRVRFTPNLAAFAEGSVVFERHTTEAEQSGTAFASLFSGVQAPRHGVYSHPARLPDELQLVSETFAAKGYESWFWSGHPMAGSLLNYGQGVPPERVHLHQRSRLEQVRPEDAMTWTANGPEFDDLLDGLAKDRSRRAFVQIDFTLSHGPYYRFCTKEQVAAFCREFPERAGGITSEELERFQKLFEEHWLEWQWDFPETARRVGLTREDRAKLALTMQVFYETDLRELDRLFGMFLERIRGRGLLDDSLVVFTSDHGEVLDRDNVLFHWTHGLQLAPESLDVPLIVHAPRLLKPGRYSQVTRSIDVHRTLAGLCGIATPDPSSTVIDGVDLSPALLGQRAPPELLAFSHSTVPGAIQFDSLKRFAQVTAYFPRSDPALLSVRVRSADLVCKLRNLGEEKFGFELFDLARDPEETRNIFDRRQPAHADLARALDSYKAELVRGFERIDAARRLSRDEEEGRLRSLGYVK